MLTRMILQELRFPEHKVSLSLEHNPHRTNYETIEEWLKANCKESSQSSPDDCRWLTVRPEDRDLILRTGEVWTLQWYPDTPVGFCAVAAASLERVLEIALESEAPERNISE